MSLPRGQFKRPYTKYVPTTGEAARIPTGPIGQLVGKDEWARAQYRAASRAGATKAQMESRYNHSDLVVMDAHVDQMFWQMVRHELRSNPQVTQWLEFIESYYEMPQHEFLERIKKRYWAQMQKWTDDRRHQAFLTELMRAYRAAKAEIDDVDPANDERKAKEAWLKAQGEAYAARVRRERAELERDAIEPELLYALDDEAEFHRREQVWMDSVDEMYDR